MDTKTITVEIEIEVPVEVSERLVREAIARQALEVYGVLGLVGQRVA